MGIRFRAPPGLKRQSNLAFNREFPKLSGLSGIPRDNRAFLQRDRGNPFDPDAVGVWLEGQATAMGWLYRKDANRPVVLEKLDRSQAPIAAHVELRNGKKVVVFWL